MPELNISSRSDDWRACRLSNFSADLVVLNGQTFASVEGFIQGIKFPVDHHLREWAARSVGLQAKRFGRYAEREFVWWQGQTISYGSAEHYYLIERAVRAKFEQNPGAMNALLATAGLELVHDTGQAESRHTSLPAIVFCDILTRIREEALRAR